MTSPHPKNTPTSAEAMVKMLGTDGVRRISGLYGDTTLPLDEAAAPVSEWVA